MPRLEVEDCPVEPMCCSSPQKYILKHGTSVDSHVISTPSLSRYYPYFIGRQRGKGAAWQWWGGGWLDQMLQAAFHPQWPTQCSAHLALRFFPSRECKPPFPPTPRQESLSHSSSCPQASTRSPLTFQKDGNQEPIQISNLDIPPAPRPTGATTTFQEGKDHSMASTQEGRT